MTNRKKIGCKGEALALTYLERYGFQLVARNYRHGHGEIDLIVIKTHLMVFVEVKTRSNTKWGLPEASLSFSQQETILNTAECFLSHHHWPSNVRFDVVAIVWDHPPVVDHFEDAF